MTTCSNNIRSVIYRRPNVGVWPKGISLSKWLHCWPWGSRGISNELSHRKSLCIFLVCVILPPRSRWRQIVWPIITQSTRRQSCKQFLGSRLLLWCDGWWWDDHQLVDIPPPQMISLLLPWSFLHCYLWKFQTQLNFSILLTISPNSMFSSKCIHEFPWNPWKLKGSGMPKIGWQVYK